LKKRFTKEPVLAVPDLDKKWRLVVFLSKSQKKIQKNYKIHDKEILAIIIELEN